MMVDEQQAAGGTPAKSDDGVTPQQQEVPQTWDAWITTQPDSVRKLYEGHTSGLKTALEKERDERAALAKQIKDLAKGQQEGSEARAKLDEMSKQLTEAQCRAEFLEDALRPEIGLVDANLAWLLVQSGEFSDTRGRVNWGALKGAHPVLFKQHARTSPANAGDGTGSPPPGKQDMNAIIRRAAGR